MRVNKSFFISIIKGIYLVTVFAVACLCFSRLLNQGNTDLTSDMSKASLPVIHIIQGDMDVNFLYGYLQEMETGFMRDTLTIVDSERHIDFEMDTYGSVVEDMYFEIRSIDGERLVEQTDISWSSQGASICKGSFNIKDLITDGREYMLIFVVSTRDHPEIRYYSRLIWSEDLHVEEKLAYVYDFSDRTFDKDRARELTKYLESDSSGDNSGFTYTDIHSSFKQVTWGDLTISRLGKPRITISELTPATGYFRVSYQVSILEESGSAICNVNEYFRIRYTADRMYLLSWIRELEQIPDERHDIYSGDQIELGMAGSDLKLMESDAGDGFAFVDAGKLISVNTTDQKVSLLFGFYDEDLSDLRCSHRDYGIRILSVDETGDVDFMVYGYMNRGQHEGRVGISIYSYNSAYNTIEEKAYIGFNGSASILMRNVEELAYADREGHEYYMLERAVYKVDSQNDSVLAVATDLSDDSYKVSDSGQMLVWQTDGGVYDCTKLRMINLATGISEDIKAGYAEYIRPLGFMGDDCVYGLAKTRDVSTGIDGNVIFPMYKLVIRSSSGEIYKTYSEPGVYVMDYEFDRGLINLHRAEYNEALDRYDEIDDDQIVRVPEVDEGDNRIVQVVTEPLETIVQISMKTELKDDEIMFLSPREIVREVPHELTASEAPEPAGYYVYGLKGYIDEFMEASNAVNSAYGQAGIVLDGRGDYIWYKTTRSGRNQIMAITEPEQTDESDSLAACIDEMLRYEGITTNSSILLSQGHNAFDILDSYMAEASVLNLTGCNLDAVLYYVNMDIPVLAIMNDQRSYLITGFNESQIVLYDPAAGELRKESITDMDNAFRADGYRFITYMR